MSRTVLVVDDDLDLRAALEEVLVDAGYKAVLAQNAEHALLLLDSIARPCLVLLDVTMPGAGAEGFLRAIENQPDADKFAVVLMSGMRGVAVRSSGRIAANLNKPFEMDDLLALLEVHCGTPSSSRTAS
jgi:two-component system chemotaxis response regulator CheY